MTKRTKGWLIAAISLMLIGSILFVGVMSKMNWKLNKGGYTTNTHAVTEAFTNLSVDVKTPTSPLLRLPTAPCLWFATRT